jgi:adenylate kinase
MKKSKKLFFVIGCPGSGKTSVLKQLTKDNVGISHFSIGDLYRNEKNKNSTLGKIIANYIDKGDYVPVEIAIQVLFESIQSADTMIIIIDGYPRNIQQLIAFEELLIKTDICNLIKVFDFFANDEIIKKRIQLRQRYDDDFAKLDDRICNYYKDIEDVKTYYSGLDKMIEINGNGSVKEVAAKLLNTLLNFKEN